MRDRDGHIVIFFHCLLSRLCGHLFAISGSHGAAYEVFWVITPCTPAEVYRRFSGDLSINMAMMMEVACTFETS